MFGTSGMFGRLKRLGTTPTKNEMTFELRELKWENDRGQSTDISLICVELRRGHHIITSSSKILPQDQTVITFDESLSLNLTLYKQSSGKFMEKVGRLLVIGHSTSKKAAVVLGSVDVPLHRLASDFQRQAMVFPIRSIIGPSGLTFSLSCVIHLKYLGDGHVAGDNSSKMSSEVGGIRGNILPPQQLSESTPSQPPVDYAVVYSDRSERTFVQPSPGEIEKLRLQRLKEAAKHYDDDADEKGSMGSSVMSAQDLERQRRKQELKRLSEKAVSPNADSEFDNAKSDTNNTILILVSPRSSSSHIDIARSLSCGSTAEGLAALLQRPLLSAKASQLMKMSGKKPNTLHTPRQRHGSMSNVLSTPSPSRSPSSTSVKSSTPPRTTPIQPRRPSASATTNASLTAGSSSGGGGIASSSSDKSTAATSSSSAQTPPATTTTSSSSSKATAPSSLASSVPAQYVLTSASPSIVQRAFPPPASPAGLGSGHDKASASDKTTVSGATTVIGLSAFHQAQALSVSGGSQRLSNSSRSKPVCSSCYNQGGDFSKLLIEVQSKLSFKEEELRERENDLKTLQASLASTQNELTQVRTQALEEKKHLQDLLLRKEVSSTAGHDEQLKQLQQQMREKSEQLEKERLAWKQQQEEWTRRDWQHEMNLSKQATQLLRKDDEVSTLQHQLSQLETSTAVLSEENAALMMELERVRKQAAVDTTKHMASEARCRAELKDEHEELVRMQAAWNEATMRVRTLEAEQLSFATSSAHESQRIETSAKEQEEKQQQQRQLLSRLEHANASLGEELSLAREELARVCDELAFARKELSAASSQLSSSSEGKSKGIHGSRSSTYDDDEYADSSVVRQQRISMAEKDAEISRLQDLLLRVELSSAADHDEQLQQLQQQMLEHTEQLENERLAWKQQQEGLAQHDWQHELDDLRRQLERAKEDNALLLHTFSSSTPPPPPITTTKATNTSLPPTATTATNTAASTATATAATNTVSSTTATTATNTAASSATTGSDSHSDAAAAGYGLPPKGSLGPSPNREASPINPHAADNDDDTMNKLVVELREREVLLLEEISRQRSLLAVEAQREAARMDEVRSIQQALSEEDQKRSDLTKSLTEKNKEIHRLLALVDTLKRDHEQMVTDQAVEDHGSTRDRETIHDLRQEIDAYRTQVRRLTTDAPAAASTSASAAVDNDRSTLLAEVLKSRQQIDQLTQKLKAAQSQSTHSKSRGGSALGTLHAMEDRLVQVENERDHERRQHEHQIKKILKATGGYDKAHFDRLMGGDNSNHGTHERPPVDLSDEIVDLFRQSQDDERLKVMTLKSILMQYSHKLTEEDLETLLDAGVVLVPAGSTPNRKKKGINFGAAMCISPSL